jgi:pilus assembly protein FimV
MTRKLTKLLTGFSVCLPASAFALGLGQIEVRSALNQPLDAEIPLVSVNAEELPGLRARLASSQVFGQYGIERLPLLLTLDFSVQTDAAGRHVIQVSSNQPIREPLINFLVQVDGPDGQLLREYAVLLDLPTVTMRQPAASGNSSQSTISTQANPIYGDPVLNTDVAHRGSVSYGPVAYGNTLWDIAGQVRPDPSIDRERMMQALLEANPEAFFRPDINSLSAGATLRIPSAQELDPARFSESASRQLAQQQAASAVAEQAVSPGLPDDDLPRVRLVPADAEQASSALETTGTGATGSGIAPPFRIILEDDRPQLRMAGVNELRERLGGAPQGSENTTGQSTAAAQEQTASGNLTTQQAMTQAETSTGITMPSLDTTAQEALPQVGRPQQFTAQQEGAAADETGPQGASSNTAIDSATENTTAAGVETPDTDIAPSQSVAATTPPNTNMDGADGALSESDDSDSGMFAFLKDPISLAMIGSLLLFLMALPLFLLARRQVKDDKSAPAFEAITPEGVALEEAALAAEPVSLAALSKPAERTRTEPLAKTTLTGSDTNPLEQADLLIAVGNYKEAEQLVRRALLRSPHDTPLASKLLDIHFASGNAAAFAKDAQLLRDRLGDESDPVWIQVATRGRELCPGNKLFADSGEFVFSESSTKPQSSELATDKGNDDVVTRSDVKSGLPFDQKTGPVIFDKNPEEFSDKVFSSESPQALERTQTRSDLEWELPDMEPTPSEKVSSSEFSQEPERTETRSDLEWELPDMEPPTVATTGLPDEEPQQGDMESQLKGLDFEFEDVQSTQEPVTSDSLSLNIFQEKNQSTTAAPGHTQDLAAELKSQSDTLNSFLDNLDEKLASPGPVGKKLEQTRDLKAEAKSQDEGSTFALDNLDEPTTFIDDSEQEEPSASEDYVQTKLDLAVAYMDMGDSVGARSLLQEVMREGTDHQKQRAEACVAKLG